MWLCVFVFVFVFMFGSLYDFYPSINITICNSPAYSRKTNMSTFRIPPKATARSKWLSKSFAA
jgi:hypothetical protein